MINDDVEKCSGISTDFIRKLTIFFIIIGVKTSTNIPLRKINQLRKIATLTGLYVTLYLHLDDHLPYSYKKIIIFETHINSNLKCINGYTNCMRYTDLITWVSNYSWDTLLSEFIHAVKIIPCPMTTIRNKCEQSNTCGDILNASDNVDDKEILYFLNHLSK